MKTEEHALIALQLDTDPNYRVLRRLQPRQMFTAAAGNPLAKGIVIDTETTGLNYETEKIIEIGLIAFEYDTVTGQVIRVIDRYSGLEDPGHPLSAEIQEITGITDAMVAGQRIDDARVNALVADASLVIAHNAQFDRPFLERRLSIFADLAWGCSLVDIDWMGEKLGARKLDYIAMTQGFFFDAHRAEDDCWALLEILSRDLPVSKQPALKSVMEHLNVSEYRVFALNSPFATKDSLKARQYRWDGERKVWYRSLFGEAAFQQEAEWLKDAIYAGRNAIIEIEVRDAHARFALRSGSVKKVTL